MQGNAPHGLDQLMPLYPMDEQLSPCVPEHSSFVLSDIEQLAVARLSQL